MSRRTYVIKRVAFSVFALYLVLSLTFAFIALTADPGVARAEWGAAQAARSKRLNDSERKAFIHEAVAEYKHDHELDVPVWDRYVNWFSNVLTLDWGKSFQYDEPVTTILGRAIPATLRYVVPAILFALVGGIGLGLYSALRPGTTIQRLIAGGSYLGFGIPSYWLLFVIGLLGLTRSVPQFVPGRFVRTGILSFVLGISLLAGQFRYARAESREYVYRQFVKLLRAKGASNWHLARHVLRNAAIPLLSLFFADLVGTLFVNVFVLENVFFVHGIGRYGLVAIQHRDLPLVLGVALVIAFAGILGNLVQDLAYLALDPRIDSE